MLPPPRIDLDLLLFLIFLWQEKPNPCYRQTFLASCHMKNAQLHFLGIIGWARDALGFHFALFQVTLINPLHLLSLQLCSLP